MINLTASNSYLSTIFNYKSDVIQSISYHHLLCLFTRHRVVNCRLQATPSAAAMLYTFRTSLSRALVNAGGVYCPCGRLCRAVIQMTAAAAVDQR